MASAIHGFLVLTILLPLLSTATAARPFHIHPCKTIFFISSSSNGTPNLSVQNFTSTDGGRYITFFFTNPREFNPRPNSAHSLRPFNPFFFDRTEMELNKPHLPSNFNPSVTSSFRDRTIDIMSVVGSLLFGVGCGALTAATMYLIWYLFSPRRFEFEDSDDNDSDYEDASPKKMGYVAIPAVTTAVVPAPAKEVDSNNLGRRTSSVISIDINGYSMHGFGSPL